MLINKLSKFFINVKTKLDDKINMTASHRATNSGSSSHTTSATTAGDVQNPWECILCHKISHFKGLGDLFGPYYIDFTQQQETNKQQNDLHRQQSHTATSNLDATASTNNMISATATTSLIQKPQTSYSKRSNNSNKNSLLNNNNNNHMNNIKEIWVHEDCLVWSEGVHLIGTKIARMEEVIKSSLRYNCSICKTKGPTIGCKGARCRRKFHFNCARDSGCLLDDANFTLKCDKCRTSTAAKRSLSINF